MTILCLLVHLCTTRAHMLRTLKNLLLCAYGSSRAVAAAVMLQGLRGRRATPARPVPLDCKVRLDSLDSLDL